MKHLVKVSVFLNFLLFHQIIFATGGDPITKNKTINKNLEFSGSGTVNLVNKFGDITINTWDKEQLTLRIDVEVTEKDEKSAQKTMDNISFEFTEQRQKFDAFTKIGKGSFSKFVWNVKDGQSNLTINYTLNIPKSALLNIKNSFGNVSIVSSKGSAEIIISYGNLIAGALTHVKEIDVEFGDIDVKSAKTIEQLKLQYAKGTIGSVSSVDLNSHFSDLTINKANKITGDCQYGSISVNEVTSIDLDAQFCDVKILSVSSDVKIDAQYVQKGSILGVAKTFKEIDLDLQFSEFDISFDEGANYTAELDGSFSKFKFSNIMVIQQKSDMSEDYYLLKKGDGGSILKIDAQYSKVKF